MARLLRLAMAVPISMGMFFLGKRTPSICQEAWATSSDQCSHVFIRKGRANQIGFTARSDQYGGGFIVEADRLRGKSASCTIKNKKEDGQAVNIVVGCDSDIMLSNVQFSLKVLEPNKISRTFPGVSDVELNYYRCPI